MEEKYIDDAFLARWVAGELTPEELDAFQNSKDYLEFKRINDGAQILEAPKFDQQASFIRLQDELSGETQDAKIVKIIPRWIYSVAATVVVAAGIFFFLNNSSSSFETGFGEQKTVTLPDNSKVYLNAKSTLAFNKRDWESNRILKFSGEAFFDVEKGTSFKVVTNQGVIEVLGTEFNVITGEKFFEVRCHEGKVRVSNNSDENLATLTQGKAVRMHDNKEENWNFNQEKPTWIKGESSFTKTPLKQVIKTLEGRYDVVFDTKTIDLNRRFTGSFTHKDFNLALKTVFTPLNISYSKKGKMIYLKGKN